MIEFNFFTRSKKSLSERMPILKATLPLNFPLLKQPYKLLEHNNITFWRSFLPWA